MLEKFRKGKDDKQTKATDRMAYMEASVPAWQTQSMSRQRSRGYSALMARFHGWVYAAAMINARGVAAQSLKLYSARPTSGAKSIVDTRKIGSAKAAYLRGQRENKPSTFVQRKSMHEEVVEVFSHPVLDLLDSPSPEMDGYTLTMQRMLNLQLTGNAYLHPIVSDTIGVPIELWNMQSDLVAVMPDGELDLVDFYQYGRLPNVKDFRKDEVLHEKIPNPSDPFYGLGWVAAATSAIDLLDTMDEFEQNTLDNQARPDWAVMVKEHLTDAQYQRLYQQIEKRLRGKNNRGQPFIFEGAMDGKSMSFAPNELGFTEGENRKVEVIAAISGVSVTQLKANDPNLSNAREGSLGWLRGTIVPYLALDEGFLNRQLLPMFGEFADTLFLAYDDPVPQDRTTQATINASDAAAGIRTRNEIRSDMGLEPVVGGDELLVPAGSIPIDVAIEQARNPQPMFGQFAKEETETKAPPVPVDGKCPDGWHYMNETDSCMEGESHPSSTYSIEKADDCVSNKISILISEGYSQEQAAAIAYAQCSAKATESKGVPETVDSPKAPEDREWDAGEAIARIKKWATNADGEISWKTYRKAFAWYDGERQEFQESYKLPHHDVIDGTLKVVLHGVNSALAFLSRTEMNPSDEAKAKAHLEYHREQFGKDVEEKSHECQCKKKKKPVSAKTLWEKSRSLVGDKAAPIDRGNSDWESMMRETAKPTNAFRDQLVSIFSTEIEGFLENSGGLGEFITSAEADQKFRKITGEFVDEIMLTTGQRELDRLGVERMFNPLNPTITNALDDYKSQLVETLIVGTGKEIRDKVDLGMRHGDSTDEIAERIRSLLAKEPESGRIPIEARAEMIARTEVAMINEIGRLEAWKQSDVVKAKQWQLAAGACESCSALAALQPNPIPLEAVFAKSGDIVGKIRVWRNLMTAPLHPNCRCGTVEVFEEELETGYEQLEGF